MNYKLHIWLSLIRDEKAASLLGISESSHIVAIKCAPVSASGGWSFPNSWEYSLLLELYAHQNIFYKIRLSRALVDHNIHISHTTYLNVVVSGRPCVVILSTVMTYDDWLLIWPRALPPAPTRTLWGVLITATLIAFYRF